ncbi:hypothetical protein FBU31_005028, partial [Coemansia sp. 'formosensis']
MPWTELRRIIRQKLAHAVELLIRRQEKADAVARQEEEREDANSSDLSDDTPAPATDDGARKRGRFESESTAADVRIDTNGSHRDEDNDEIMDEAAADSALAAEADSAMAVSEVTPEPSSPASGQEEPAGGDPAPTNGDSSAIAPEAPHGGPAAEDGPKEEQAVGGPVDAVREMRDLEERIGHCLRT